MSGLSSARVDLATVTSLDERENPELVGEILKVYTAIRSLQGQMTEVLGGDPPNFEQAQSLELESLYSVNARTKIKVKAASNIILGRALHLSSSGSDLMVRHTTGNAASDTALIGLAEQNAAAGEYFFVSVYPSIITVPFDLTPGLIYYSWIDGALITDTFSVPTFSEGNSTMKVGLAVGRRKMQILSTSGIMFV